jgi:CBS domain containing-hemolysin-like protein
VSRAGAVSTSTRTDRGASGVGRKHTSLLRDRVYKEEDYKTVGGMVMVHLGHVPRPGDRFEWEGFSFEVVDLTASAIDKMLVARASK